MVIDFENDSIKIIDSVVKYLQKKLGRQYTRGKLRTFVVDTVISSMNEKCIESIIINRFNTGV